MNFQINLFQEAASEHLVLAEFVLIARFTCFHVFPELCEIEEELAILANQVSYHSGEISDVMAQLLDRHWNHHLHLRKEGDVRCI